MRLKQILIFENVLNQLLPQFDEPTRQAIQSIPELHFQQWAAELLKDGQQWMSIIDAIDYYREKIKDNRFQEILKKVTPTPKNILSLDLSQIKIAQAEYDSKYNAPSKRSLKKTGREKYTKTLIDNDDIKIIEIRKTDGTDGAATILSDLARGTRWCVTDVATGNKYLDSGPLHLMIVDDKKFLCSISTRQLMDEEDQSVDLSDEYMSIRYRNIIRKYGFKYIPGFVLVVLDIYDTQDSPYREKYKEDLLKYGSVDSLIAFAWALSERWPEAEPKILTKPLEALKYAVYLGFRWIEAEPLILKALESVNSGTLELATKYAKTCIGGRWLAAEPMLVKHINNIPNYASTIIKNRWPEGEKTLFDETFGNAYYQCAHTTSNLFDLPIYIGYYVSAMQNLASNGEISQDSLLELLDRADHTVLSLKYPTGLVQYMTITKRGEWPEAERFLKSNPKYSNELAHYKEAVLQANRLRQATLAKK